MVHSKFSISLKSILIGVLTGGVCCAGFLGIISFLICLSGKLALWILQPLSLMVISLSGFISGYITGKLTGEKGILYGLACGLGMFSMIFIGGIIVSNSEMTLFLLWKAIAIIISGCLGGIIGVNKS